MLTAFEIMRLLGDQAFFVTLEFFKVQQRVHCREDHSGAGAHRECQNDSRPQLIMGYAALLAILSGVLFGLMATDAGR